MDAIQIPHLVIPNVPAPAPASGQDAAPPPANPSPQSSGSDSGSASNLDMQQAERMRLEAVQQRAQGIANTHILGDSDFTIFKDATGQLVTRYRNLTSGQITYIPQPTLFKMDSISGGDAVPLLTLQA